MLLRSPRPSLRGFSIGVLLATVALFVVLYGTIVNIAEASRALAASKESLARSRRAPVAALEARRGIDVHRGARAAKACEGADVRGAALASSAPAPADEPARLAAAATHEADRSAGVSTAEVRHGAADR